MKWSSVPLPGAEEAETLARNAHAGQVDKGGQPYIEHCQRVALYTGMMGGTWVDRSVAWLHDVVEDTPVTLDDLRNYGFPLVVRDAVDAMTRREGETNKAYVLRVAENSIATLVKRADYLDNMDPRRLLMLPRDEALRLARVMADSQYILIKALFDDRPE